MNITRKLSASVTALLLCLNLSSAQADPLALIPDGVNLELLNLMSCFTCQRVRQATEVACLMDIRDDGGSTWPEEFGCYLQGLLVEQDCLDNLQCL